MGGAVFSVFSAAFGKAVYNYDMNRSLIALALAFSVLPTAALAQNAGERPALTDQQRQAVHQTFERYAQQEEQLHQQMRDQILSALTPVHRRAVAATIGELAIEANPDPQAAAKRLDMMLSGAERGRILAAHEAFKQQSTQLHQQMRSELQSELPAGHSPMDRWSHAMSQHPQPDAGTILLMALSPHSRGMGWPGHGEGAPPQ
jgi:hypothetical protein